MGLNQEILEVVFKYVPDMQKMKILDAGCGPGSMNLEFIKKGATVALVDYSQKVLAKTKKIFTENVGPPPMKWNLYQQDIRKMYFQDGTFDLTWSSGTIEHFDKADLALVLREMIRLSRKWVITFAPNNQCAPYEYWKEKQRKEGTWPYGIEDSKQSMRKEFEAFGLTVLEEGSVGSTMFDKFIRESGYAGVYNNKEQYLLYTIGRKDKK